ncbi:subtilisin-like protease SBT5.4 [Rhododendron vialii]|uniref:subtilisin-like protease SBT5.4 n=1 Tax=Rhododendron vialii TaxID=182163 RepID=UPI00266014D5|nr:subtilisin-like protease SBT5.4 [Rhododendron vialii]
MLFSKFLLLLGLLALPSFFLAPAFAAKQSYIVYMGAHSNSPLVAASATVSPGVHNETHCQFLASFLGSTEKAEEAMFYSYTKDINGFAATLDEAEAAEIAKHPNVLSIFVNKPRHLHTTHSWEFMMLEKNGLVEAHSLWEKAKYGEDIIIANLDTGVWPESQSFSDNGYGPIPSKWKGSCQNDTTTGVPCNRKLIGAKYFLEGYIKGGGTAQPEMHSARDYEGHGSHTLSTAGGNFVHDASVLGVFNGTAKGGSPKARVAAYKVCWPSINLLGGCFDADILNAFEAAIQDGVDVLSLSLGGTASPYFNDGIAIGAFHAVRNGIVVVCSAGNDGPNPGSVSNVAPWILTVAASTLDRDFASYVQLNNGLKFKGASLSKPLPGNGFLPLISGAVAKAANASETDALHCMQGSLDPEKVKGKILVCLRGVNGRVEKGQAAALAGAAGMILCNALSDGNGLIADPHVLPTSHINYTAGLAVFAYLNSTSVPLGRIDGPMTELNQKPAPVTASFSSRGPNKITPEILKPDITAPGVNVIAAYSEAVKLVDNRTTPFITESGTSMSCPHVSGVVGLLKKLHPDWSPAAIKSAIMTTARSRDNTGHTMLDESTFLKATPLDFGSGHIQPTRAADPGLVYDLGINDYLDFLCATGYNRSLIQLFSQAPYTCQNNTNLLNFNYPSITVPNLSGSVTVTRTLKNVGPPSTYIARIVKPPRISVSIKPRSLKFHKVGEEKSFKLTLKAEKAGFPTDYVFGELIWVDSGRHSVRSPIVVASGATNKSTAGYIQGTVQNIENLI